MSQPAVQHLFPEVNNTEARPLTAREQASIALKLPHSGTGWLDDMIRAAARRDAATIVTAGFISRYGAANAGELVDKVEAAFTVAGSILEAAEEDWKGLNE